jgi:ribosomal protein L13E
MKSLRAVKAVLAAIGVAMDQLVGFSLPSLKAAGLDIAAFRAGECDWSTIRAIGFTAVEVKAAGCDFASAQAAGFDALSLVIAFGRHAVATAGHDVRCDEMETAGCTAAEVRAAGCDPSSAKAAGYDAAACRVAGFNLSSLKAAGFDLPSLKAAGFDVTDFRSAGHSWMDVKTLGFSAAEAKAAGCDPASAQAAGFDVLSLVVAFGFDSVAAAGCDVSFLKEIRGHEKDFASCILVRFLLCLRILCAQTESFFPLPVTPLQRDGTNLYMTLHLHKIDDRRLVKDGDQSVHVPDGWQIADGTTHDVRVCGAHPWQSHFLVFANGDEYGTAMCSIPSYIGACP